MTMPATDISMPKNIVYTKLNNVYNLLNTVLLKRNSGSLIKELKLISTLWKLFL